MLRRVEINDVLIDEILNPMTDHPPKSPESSKPTSTLNPSHLEQLRAEAKAPFRGFRRFFYIAFAGSGFLGGFIFLLKLLAGEDFATTFPNLMLQIGVFVLMLWLLRVDSSKST